MAIGSVISTTGLVVSGIFTMKVTESVPIFPATSLQVTVHVFVPTTEVIPVIVLTPFTTKGIFTDGFPFNL